MAAHHLHTAAQVFIKVGSGQVAAGASQRVGPGEGEIQTNRIQTLASSQTWVK